jgi:hydrogenase expression/formation protein HypC
MCLGIPGRIVEIVDERTNQAIADFGGARRAINIACVVSDERPAAACVGDWVLVHVGFAMSRIDEAEAAATLALLRQMGEAIEAVEAAATRAPRP